MANNLSLLSTQSRVATPFIKVAIGEYVLGIFQKTERRGRVKFDQDGQVYKTLNIKYPNYVQSLEVKKINGQVNQYTLNLTYQITPDDDPNLIEKMLSSVSTTRKITFSYGDLSAPNFIYKNDEAIIVQPSMQFSMESAQIMYTITAVSNGVLARSGSFTFKGRRAKPSDVIKSILYDKTYGLTEVFTGMRSRGKVLRDKLIADNDQIVEIDTKINITPLDYLLYLVSCMKPANTAKSKTGVYTLTIYDDTSGEYAGTYFKVTQIEKVKEAPGMVYELEIGVPNNKNVVTALSVTNNEAWSIFYDYSKKISDAEYVQRIDSKGNLVDVFAPIVSSGNPEFKTNASTASWWRQITQYPIKGSVTIKGLLRPATLMQYVRLKLYYYGRLHIISGLYIVTSQTDRVDMSGFTTTLGLLRVGGDDTI